MGRWVCPNITAGQGGRTKDFKPADWDRVIRHGVGKDNRGLSMPSRDFANLSDQEVSDIIALKKAGVSDKVSADQLKITLSTYNNHLQHIYKKLAVTSKREAIEKLKGSRN